MATNKKLIQVRLAPDIYEELKRLSKEQRRSLSNLVGVIIINEIAAIRKSTKGLEGGDIDLRVVPSKIKKGK